MPQALNYINGRWVEAKSGRTFGRENPATGETVGSFPDSGPDDTSEAVKAAAEAFERWRLTPAPRRAEILFRAGEIMLGRKEDLSRDVTAEMGKVLQATLDSYHTANGRRSTSTTPATFRKHK